MFFPPSSPLADDAVFIIAPVKSDSRENFNASETQRVGPHNSLFVCLFQTKFSIYIPRDGLSEAKEEEELRGRK